MWETSSHERVHVFALSDPAQKQLRKIANTIPRELSTETNLPPLQAPLLIRPVKSIKRNLKRFFFAIKRFFFAITRIRRSIAHNDASPPPLQACAPNLPTQYWQIPLHFLRILLTRLQYITRKTVPFLLSGFQNHHAAIRWRPLVVLVHLSTTGRNPLKTLFTGIVEGSVLLVLTFFFSAQWAGNLVVTMYSVAYLLLAVSAARGLGLVYIKWSVRAAGLHLVECESVDEIYGALRVLCSMRCLLVRVNGAWFFEGKRLDSCAAFWEWELRSERGEFDDEKLTSWFKLLGANPAPAHAGPTLPPKTSSSVSSAAEVLVGGNLAATTHGGNGKSAPSHHSTM
jgi:hypothetical protein